MSTSLEDKLGGIVPAHALDRWIDEDLPECPRISPEEESQFQDALRLAAKEDLRVLPVGLGSKLGWIRRPARVDFVLSTSGYRGVTSYEPADGTVTARGGTPMADLRAVVGEGGHHLSPSVPHPEGSTLGGVIATGQSGDDRMRYGALRENLLGTRVVLSDGTVAKSGGQLVKNVTGYDLHRAQCGSFGSFCLVLEGSLRLYPLPDARALFLMRAPNRGDALDLAAWIHRLPVRPVSLLVHDLDSTIPGLPWTVLVVLAGREEVVASECKVLEERWPEATLARGSEVNAVATDVRDIELSGDRWPALSIEARPSQLQEVLVALPQEAGACGYEIKLLVHPTVARAVVWLMAGPADAADAELLQPERVAALDERLSKLPIVARWRDLPAPAAAAVQPLGRPGYGLEFMRKLRGALDPANVFAPRLFDQDI